MGFHRVLVSFHQVAAFAGNKIEDFQPFVGVHCKFIDVRVGIDGMVAVDLMVAVLENVSHGAVSLGFSAV